MKVSSEVTLSSTANVEHFFSECRATIDATLENLIPAATLHPQKVHEAIRWSVFAGGKRFRPALLWAVGETLGVCKESLIRPACAIELIHTYSLIHDDLPSMDNDDLRRGRPTCHIRFGEAIAILAGDALQTLAFKTIAEDDQLSLDLRVRLIREIAVASGTPEGMVAGQVRDLDAETMEVTGDELEQIHRLKTGALIVAAARAGAMIAKAEASELDSITEYAGQLGLLFQITDDLLDVTATAEALGKTPGKDFRSQKATYPGLYGLAAARSRASEVHAATCKALDRIDRETVLLRSIAHFIWERDR